MSGKAKLLSGFNRIFDYRFVYLQQERNNRKRDFWKRKDEKIGISVDVSRRTKQIEKTMNGRKLKTLFSIPIFYAAYYEKKLHGRFKRKQRRKKGRDGGTEFFDLGWLNRLVVIVYLVGVFLWQWVAILMSIIFLITIYKG